MLDRSDGFAKSNLDSEVEERIAEHCARFAIDPLTAVKHFPVLARRQLLKRFLAHVELFKLALEVPGDIVVMGNETVHASMANLSSRTRLSVDFRFFGEDSRSSKHYLDLAERRVVAPAA